MNASENSREVVLLVKRLRSQYPDAALPPAAAGGEPASAPAASPCDIEPGEPLLCEFIRSFMMWESTTAKADAALRRLHEAVVDFNELRICLPDELIRVMGERYPRVEDRAMRLRAALGEIYRRQHAVTLEPLASMSKREAKDYLDSLEGVPRYVSSRLLLVRIGAHSAPVDGRIARRLVEAEIAENGSTPEAAAGSLERKVKAGDLLEVYQLLQAWADDAPVGYGEAPADPPRRSGRSAPSNNHAEPARKKTGKPAASTARRRPTP